MLGVVEQESSHVQLLLLDPPDSCLKNIFKPIITEHRNIVTVIAQMVAFIRECLSKIFAAKTDRICAETQVGQKKKGTPC